MPKRPCAIAFTSDDETILCADKFGDVYSLPLIPSEEMDLSQRQQAPAKTKPFKPSASHLTVHTKRNLAALELQLKQTSVPAKEKAGPKFEHKLLLGHVSMLTDLAFVSLPATVSPSDHACCYLLTADRDEHIRVSRGPPQSYVIENYCLGHTAFISRLCIPQYAPGVLISGGGDDYLLVWKWLEGRVLQKVPLTDRVQGGAEVTVRGIWSSSFSASMAVSGAAGLIFVALDG